MRHLPLMTAFTSRGIVNLLSVSPFIRGHSDRDVGDIMSACQRAQTSKPIRSLSVNTEQPVRLLSVHVHHGVFQPLKI